MPPYAGLDELYHVARLAFVLEEHRNPATTGERWWGRSGLVGAALVAFIPTWETLVTRASNDAFACALVAVAVAVTAWGRGRGALEALLWALAIAAKLYTWPLAIVLPF